jgi:uncharacterized protein involved in outer membrane biogenesis
MKRLAIILGIIVLVLAGGGLLGFRLAVQMLKGKVAAALGAGGAVKELNVGWSSVELVGLEIEGPKGWPAKKTLDAARVTVAPSLRSLLGDQIQISSITVEKPYISVLRTPGKLLILPSLLEAGDGKQKKKTSSAEPSARSVLISEITLQQGIIEIFDETVSRPALKVRLEQIEAVVRNLTAPSLKERTHFDLAAVVKGKQHDGKMKISGWIEQVGRDSSSEIVLNAVDLVSLQPYLVKKGETQLSKGTLDLNLKSEVRNNQLDGKGKIVIRDLQFAPGRGTLDTFMGLPRNAVIGFLKNNQGAIDLDFVLKGDVSQPEFSLNEALSTRIASAMAGQLGVSIKGVAEGIGTLGRKGVEGAAGVTDAIGSAVKGLFGGEPKK